MKTNEPQSPSQALEITQWMPLATDPANLPIADMQTPPCVNTLKGPKEPDTAAVEGDYTAVFSYPSKREYSLWHITCTSEQAKQLGLEAGEYTLLRKPTSSCLNSRSLERIQSLETSPHVATLLQYRQGVNDTELWYEPLGGCTLTMLLNTRTRLKPAEVTTLAEELASALAWAHHNHFAYPDLTSDDLAFTLDGKVKLLTPHLDFRGAPAPTSTKHKAEDTRLFAQLLWQALTGEMPKDDLLRKTLSFCLPDVPPALAHILELALDASADTMPHTAEITTALASYARAAPLNLHAATHDKMRGDYLLLKPYRCLKLLAQKGKYLLPASQEHLSPSS